MANNDNAQSGSVTPATSIADSKAKEDTQSIDLFGLSKQLINDLKDNQTRGVFQSGEEAGFTEANTQLDRRELFGYPTDPGLYHQMRYSHPIVAGAMDFRTNQVSQLEYKLGTRSSNPTESQKLACQAVEYLLTHMPYKSLNAFISETYDRVSTYGFVFYEVVVNSDNLFEFIEILPNTIDWIQLDSTNQYVQYIRVNTGDASYQIPADKLVWFGKSSNLGNYYGQSDLRKIVAIYTAADYDMRYYLSERRLQKGILYIQENELGANNNAWQASRDFLYEFYQGRNSPVMLPMGLDLKNLAASNPSVFNARQMFEYWDTLMREAVMSSLHSLGIGSFGSYALADTLSVSDAEKFVAHVDSFINILNGDTHPHSCILQTITVALGFDIKDTPRICVVDNIEESMEKQINLALSMIKDGVITPEQFGISNINKILTTLGFAPIVDIQDGSESLSDALQIDLSELSDSTYRVRSEMRNKASQSVLSIPAKYDHIDFKPPKSVANRAKQGLTMRDKHNRGGTEIAIARARNLSNRDNISPDTIKRMVSFFARHEQNKQAEGFNQGEKGYPSNGRIAWDLWGGDEGMRWANKIADQMNKADE